jgi:hypothetical protein
VLVLSLRNVDSIADFSILYTCTLQVSPDAQPGEHPPALSNLGASDPESCPEMLLGIAGAVHVADEVAGADPAWLAISR